MAEQQFIELTNLQGGKVWVGTAWIQLVRLPFSHEYADANAVVILSGENIAVKETVDDVLNLIYSEAKLHKHDPV